MQDVQIGHPVEASGFRDNPPVFRISAIRFEDKDLWNLADSLIVRAITIIVAVNAPGRIQIQELIRKLRVMARFEQAYLDEAVPRILRASYIDSQGFIKDMKFRV